MIKYISVLFLAFYLSFTIFNTKLDDHLDKQEINFLACQDTEIKNVIIRYQELARHGNYYAQLFLFNSKYYGNPDYCLSKDKYIAKLYAEMLLKNEERYEKLPYLFNQIEFWIEDGHLDRVDFDINFLIYKMTFDKKDDVINIYNKILLNFINKQDYTSFLRYSLPLIEKLDTSEMTEDVIRDIYHRLLYFTSKAYYYTNDIDNAIQYLSLCIESLEFCLNDNSNLELAFNNKEILSCKLANLYFENKNYQQFEDITSHNNCINDILTKYYLGIMYEQGLTGQKNLDLALRYYRNSSLDASKVKYYTLSSHKKLKDNHFNFDSFSLSSIASIFNLFFDQIYNMSVYADFKSKIRKIEDKEAYYQLGLLYFYGNGVFKNHSVAKKYFEAACTLDHKQACEYLRQIFLNICGYNKPQMCARNDTNGGVTGAN